MTELYESASATADATGVARARVQPLRAFEKWTVTRMTVSSTSETLVPSIKVYKGSESPSQRIDGSYDGVLNQSETNIDLPNGVALIAVWEGSDVGATCTFTVQGEKTTRGI